MESTRTKCTGELDCSCVECTYAQKKCFVFILAPDLVNRIYGLVLYEEKAERHGHSVVLVPDDIRFKRNHHGSSCLSILQTCRRINDEAAGIFYAHHPLYFRDSTIVTIFEQQHNINFPAFQQSLQQQYYDKLTAFHRFLQITSTPRLQNVTRLTLNVKNLDIAFSRELDLGKLKGLKELKVIFYGDELPGNFHKILPKIIQSRCKYWVEKLNTLESIEFSFMSCHWLRAKGRRLIRRFPKVEAEIQDILRERRARKLKAEQTLGKKSVKDVSERAELDT